MGNYQKMECVTYIHKHAPLATSSARRPAGARRGRDGLERRPRQLEEGGQGPNAAGPSSAATRASTSASGAPRERPRGGRGLGSVRIRARRRPCTGFTEGAPRVRSRRCFRHGGTESLSDFGMKRMGGGAESGDAAELRTHRGPSQTAGSARRPAPRRRQRLRGRRPGAGGGAPQLTSRG